LLAKRLLVPGSGHRNHVSSTMGRDFNVTADGVTFDSKDLAKIYADKHDKDLVEIDGGWLAKNRATRGGPMPTRDGDVVIYHFQQKYLVWVSTWDGAQGPDPNVEASTVWDADEAQQVARRWAQESTGRIFRIDKDGNWTVATN
jgi:hypothetical protein